MFNGLSAIETLDFSFHQLEDLMGAVIPYPVFQNRPMNRSRPLYVGSYKGDQLLYIRGGTYKTLMSFLIISLN